MEKERNQLRIAVLSSDNYRSYQPSTIHPVCNSSVNKEVFVMQVQVSTSKAIRQASKLDYALVGKGEKIQNLVLNGIESVSNWGLLSIIH